MSCRPRVVKTFQNANQEIKLIVQPKAKPNIVSRETNKGNFVRDCALKNELEKMENENAKRLKKNTKVNQKVDKNKKINSDQENQQIQKPQRNHHVLPTNMSWGEFFQSLSNAREDETTLSSVDKNKDKAHKRPKSVDSRKKIPPNNGTKKQSRKATSADNCEHNLEQPYVDVSVQCNIENGNMQSSIELLNDRGVQTTATGYLEEGEEAIEQPTHSPFGQSAHLLLVQLREKLKSQGEGEGSEAINMVDALIEGKGHGRTTPTSVFFPSVNHQQDCKPECFNKRMALTQQVATQHLKIEQLKKLSSELLDKHMQLKRDVEVRNQDHLESPRPYQDRATSPIHFYDDQTQINQAIVSENEALLKKLKHYGDLIVKLEQKLKEARIAADPKISDNLSPQNSRPPSADVPTHPNKEGVLGLRLPSLSNIPPLVECNYPNVQNQIPPSFLLQPFNSFSHKSKRESEFDSAFDEGTVSSKRSSPFDKPDGPLRNLAKEQQPVYHPPQNQNYHLIHMGYNRKNIPRGILNSTIANNAMNNMTTLSISCESDHTTDSKSDNESLRSKRQSFRSKKASLPPQDVIRAGNDTFHDSTIVVNPSNYLESTHVSAAAAHQDSRCREFSEMDPNVSFVSMDNEETFT